MVGRGSRQDRPLGEKVYNSLRRDLASGSISPNERLGEERLAELYGVSRTPVREALARLLADGLIERDHHGLYPYRPRLDELDGLYELRVTLESKGIQRVLDDPTLSHDHALLRAELGTWEQYRSAPPSAGSDLVIADEHFHMVLLSSSGNPALADALEAVNARVRPARALDALSDERTTTMIREHVHIAELVLAGRLRAARDSLISHIASSQTIVLDRATRAVSMAKLGLAVRD